MDKSSKLLVVASFLIVITGFILIYVGLAPLSILPVNIESSPTPTISQPPQATNSGTLNIQGVVGRVTKVVDGDTIEVNIDGISYTVRYIGVDTPETKDPRRPVGCFGKEAYEENKRLVGGQTVILQNDVSESDKYNRILRYVFLPLDDGNTLFVNDYLIRSGFGTALTIPPDVSMSERFLDAQKEAKENRLGLWSRC